MGDSQASEKQGGSRKSPIRDARGAVAVYVAIVAPVLFGVGALTLDVGRLITLHTELQAAADGAAIAGARELDRNLGSIEKAKEAAAEALANIQTFATGTKQAILDTTTIKTDCGLNPALGVPCIRFLRSLPQDLFEPDSDPPILIARGDDLPITSTEFIDPTAGTQASRDGEARFIDVHIGARDITNILVRLLMLMGQTPLLTSTTSATAVAGQDQVICNLPPMFICNPTESFLNNDPNEKVEFSKIEGHQIKLFKQGQGGGMTPGNFGLLCPLGSEDEQPNCGAKSIKDALASKTGTCLSQQLVTTKTGVTLGMVRAGINARHDYYEQQAKTADGEDWRTLDDFVPAGNVTQGGTPPNNTTTGNTACKYTKPNDPDLNADGQNEDEWIAADPNNTKQNFVPDHVETATGFPRDYCFYTNSCDFQPTGCSDASCGTNRVGDGKWAYKEYFRINHGCNEVTNPTCRPTDWPATAWPPSRYDTYRYEIEKGTPDTIVTADKTIFKDGTDSGFKTAEDGHQQCFQGNKPEYPTYEYFPGKKRDLRLLDDRKIMPIAIANCNALEATGTSTKGKFSFEIPELIYVFLTEPMRRPSDSEIYAEMLGALDEGAVEALVRDVVQIYRRGR